MKPIHKQAVTTAFMGVLTVLLGSHAARATDPPFEVIASGLDNPRGLAFGPDGALYVVEAGRGGDGLCLFRPLPGGGETVCYGATGAVTRIFDGVQERFVIGLPSLGLEGTGRNATGPVDIAFDANGDAYIIIGLGFDPVVRIDPNALGAVDDRFGRLVQVATDRSVRVVADVAGHESSNNPHTTRIDSNPYSVLALADQRFVADAGGNTLLGVDADGHVSTTFVFANRLVTPPPFLGLPPGAQIPMESVPNSIALGPDGALYVGELTGFPFPRGAARVYRVVPGEAPTVFADGFTNIIDLAFGDDGSLYVLEYAANTILSGNLTGRLVRLNADDSRQVLAGEGLISPTALAIGRDGAVYISNRGTFVGEGEVIRIPEQKLIEIMDALGPQFDTFISPLAEGAPLTTLTLRATEPLTLDAVESVYTSGSLLPNVTLVHDGGGVHTATLTPAPQPGEWLRLDLRVTGTNTSRTATVTVRLAQHPGDVNQDGVVNIRDATAFGDEFRGPADPRLVDLNGDGVVDARDATAFGDIWHGRSPATQAWNGAQLPPRP